ncbi:BMP family ABC transporter substrate-binding protein [Pendulispora rubella]|uniref:BMP family ABC transporter substrate-binding protein n=1 Tax=Pendulispora rubella TaxID=2741070 RepID=A0ABZ2KRE1_9BACT
MKSNPKKIITALRSVCAFVTIASSLGACKGSTEKQEKSSISDPANPANSAGSAASATSLTVGMILVGPKNDHGWNESHFEGIKKAIAKFPDVKFDYIDKVNPSDRPNSKSAQVADDLIARGSRLVVFSSDDFKDDALETARKHPNVSIIHVSGDHAWKEGRNYKNQKNLGNIDGAAEPAKMIAGCSAALATESGKIGYLGALANDETRRLVSSAYLGAKHCWEKYRKKPAKDLTFKVTWIGFWFNIPGVTLDPTKVVDDYFSGGFDVVMSGLDTPEAAVQSKKAAEAGKRVRFTHHDFKAGCDLSPDTCLGVSYYNWMPAYRDVVRSVREGKFTGEFAWPGPDYRDINGEESSIGFDFGRALGDKKATLEEFIRTLGDKSVVLHSGPLKFQDGSEFLKAGEVATPQKIWYMPQLLEGITGKSQ